MNMNNQYLDIDLDHLNLDVYHLRTSIYQAIKITLPKFQGKMLDVGCGKMPYKDYILNNSSVTEYIGLDLESSLVYDETIKPDIFWDGKNIPLGESHVDCVIATEVFEHCDNPEIVLREIIRVLKPGGVLFFTVPFLWNLHEIPHDEYRYTPFSLERHLRNSGFSNLNIQALGGWHASMAQMLGLWVRRSPLSDSKRKILSKLLKPLIFKLLKMDKNKRVKFEEGQMITGLSGIAYKQ